jgi:hypothetical protein
MTIEAERAAQQALDDFLSAWNNADIDAVRATLNYPHITIGPAGQVLVAGTPADFRTDFAAMREREGWHSSTFDSFETIATSPTKVHCQVLFSRYHADGSKYGTGRVLYIVTNQDGHWGMQLRSGMPDAGLVRAREGQ